VREAKSSYSHTCCYRAFGPMDPRLSSAAARVTIRQERREPPDGEGPAAEVPHRLAALLTDTKNEDATPSAPQE
jgi:hypothetical protein